MFKVGQMITYQNNAGLIEIFFYFLYHCGRDPPFGTIFTEKLPSFLRTCITSTFCLLDNSGKYNSGTEDVLDAIFVIDGLFGTDFLTALGFVTAG